MNCNAMLIILFFLVGRAHGIDLDLKAYIEQHTDLTTIRQKGQALELLKGIMTCNAQAFQTLPLFHDLLQRGVATMMISHALISACAQSKQPEVAFEAFQAMQRDGLEPDKVTYNVLLGALEEGNHSAQALEVFGAMQRQGVVADVTTYNTVISACDKGRNSTGAMNVFQAM
jgi:pentatricopeptide repeat protein